MVRNKIQAEKLTMSATKLRKKEKEKKKSKELKLDVQSVYGSRYLCFVILSNQIQ